MPTTRRWEREAPTASPFVGTRPGRECSGNRPRPCISSGGLRGRIASREWWILQGMECSNKSEYLDPQCGGRARSVAMGSRRLPMTGEVVRAFQGISARRNAVPLHALLPAGSLIRRRRQNRNQYRVRYLSMAVSLTMRRICSHPLPRRRNRGCHHS